LSSAAWPLRYLPYVYYINTGIVSETYKITFFEKSFEARKIDTDAGKRYNDAVIEHTERGISMKKIDFANEAWKQEITQAYSFRFTETPDFVQAADHITTSVNKDHREGFDNISLLSHEKYKNGVKAKLRCAFDGLGCPEIIIVEKTERCEDGAVRYGACFEVVLWKNGVNVWRHYMDEADHRCYWHKRLGLSMQVAEKDIHELEVEIIENYIVFSVDGVGVKLRTEDLPESFHVGITACEGIVRLYDFEIQQQKDESTEDQVS